jgi:hypothetical protein
MTTYTAGRAEIEALLAEYRAKAGAHASLREVWSFYIFALECFRFS